jgi:hypothetical protein
MDDETWREIVVTLGAGKTLKQIEEETKEAVGKDMSMRIVEGRLIWVKEEEL